VCRSKCPRTANVLHPKNEANVKKLLWMAAFLFFFTNVYSDEIKFQPGDTIDISVYNSPELTGSYKIYPDGYLRVPLIGKVYAKDKTENELYESIRTSVNEFIKNPYITIIPKFSVVVLGSVGKPGAYTITGSEKVLEMIALAGGFNPEASGRVTLKRNGKKIAISKKDVYTQDASLGFLKPGDILIAERKAFARSDFSLLISSLSVITLIIMRLDNRF
jgi:protein involved in polysaccharide export with SLBB domain